MGDNKTACPKLRLSNQMVHSYTLNDVPDVFQMEISCGDHESNGDCASMSADMGMPFVLTCQPPTELHQG